MSSVEKKDYSIAIDIGSSKVSVLIGERSGNDRIRIIAGNSIPLKNGAVKRCEIRNMSDVACAIKNAISIINKEDEMEIKSALFNISGSHIKCKKNNEYIYVRSKDGEVTREDVDSLKNIIGRIKPEYGTTILDNIILNYNIDGHYNVSAPVGEICNKLTCNFNSIVGDDNNMTHFNKAIGKCDVKMIDSIHSGYASAMAVLSDEEKELGVCLVDLGSGSCNIAIYHDNQLRFVSSLPYGVDLINIDIKSAGILERYIETLKTQHGNAMAEYAPLDSVISIPNNNISTQKEIPSKTLARIIEARMFEIIKGIKESIISSGYSSKLSAGVVITGGGSMLTNVDRLFKKITGYETVIGRPDKYVDGINCELMEDPRFATAIGMLLIGIKTNRCGTVVIDEPESLNTNASLFPDFEENVKEPEAVVDTNEEDDNKARKKVTKGKRSKISIFGGKSKHNLFTDEDIDEQFEEEYDNFKDDSKKSKTPKKSISNQFNDILKNILND